MPHIEADTAAHTDALEHHSERVHVLRQAVAEEPDDHLRQELQRELAFHARILSSLRSQRD